MKKAVIFFQKRIIPVFLVFAVLLCGCGRKETPSDDRGDGWLTHVFQGTEFSLPGNYSVIAADYDPERAVLRCAVSIWPEDPAAPLTYASLEMTEEGISSSLPIDLGDGHSVKCAVYVGDSLWMILPDGSDETLKRFDLKTGETDEGIGLKAQFSLSGGDSVYVQHFTADSEGNLYLYTFPEILILSPEAERLGLVQIESLNGLAADGEGRVWTDGFAPSICAAHFVFQTVRGNSSSRPDTTSTSRRTAGSTDTSSTRAENWQKAVSRS